MWKNPKAGGLRNLNQSLPKPKRRDDVQKNVMFQLPPIDDNLKFGFSLHLLHFPHYTISTLADSLLLRTYPLAPNNHPPRLPDSIRRPTHSRPISFVATPRQCRHHNTQIRARRQRSSRAANAYDALSRRMQS